MLYEHQRTGASWLAARDKSVLGDEPGTGKTYTVIEALKQLGEPRPLIVCPAIVRTHWARSLAVAGFGDGAIVQSYDGVTDAGVQQMARLIHGADRIGALVLDEYHYCKHTTSKRAQILLGNDGYARRLDRVILASGSIPKHPGEMFTMLVSLFPQILVEHGIKSKEQYMARFTIRRGSLVRGHWVDKVVAQQNVAELQQILGQVMLKRSLEDTGLDVPRVWWQTLRLDAPANLDSMDDAALLQASSYKGALEDIEREPHIARMRRRLGEFKVAPVAEMLSSQLADGDEKVVVFAHHRSVLANLRSALKGFGVAFIDGDVSDKKRNEEIDRFQTDPRCRVFLGQNIACQTGITLAAAHRVVLVEPDWTADINFQLGQRVARIGSTAKRCIGQFIALAGTLDEAIVAQNERETRNAAELFRKAG
jgi:SWI/SNF-related matrix-associated actin-dependent regulator of chromatin subfamily A-like protein 1